MKKNENTFTYIYKENSRDKDVAISPELKSENIPQGLFDFSLRTDLSSLSEPLPALFSYRRPLEVNRLADILSIGIVIVDLNQKIIGANRHFKNWIHQTNVKGTDFYKTLGDVEIDGPDFCPLATVRQFHQRTTTVFIIGSKIFELFITPNLDEKSGELLSCVIEMRDITEFRQVDQKLKTLLDIGKELADLSREDLTTMSMEDRRALLRAKAEDGIRNILNYDVCEIRLLEESTGRLLPFLAFGMAKDAACRELHAESNHSGITGYVAHNKVCYYCEETIDHPIYLPGAINARCSLTVPLLWHDTVIGTCNVESLTPGAFNERDLYYLQIFSRDLSAAIHTLNLLNYEKEFAVLSSFAAILETITSPIDQILQDTSVLLDEYSDSVAEAESLLQKTLAHSRIIKSQIGLLRQRMLPQKSETPQEPQERPLLNRRQILVLDKDSKALSDAHRILEKYNCIVETAPNALVAYKMCRVTHYDAIISEIKPDGGMSGYQFMLRLFDLYPGKPTVPLLLSTEFGYDPGHTIVSAKQKGLIGVLFKPFIPHQLLDKLEEVINICGNRDKNGNLILPEGSSPTDSSAAAISSAPSLPAESSPITPPVTTESRGFCQIQGAGRFKRWAEQMSELSDKKEENSSTSSASSAKDDMDAT